MLDDERMPWRWTHGRMGEHGMLGPLDDDRAMKRSRISLPHTSALLTLPAAPFWKNVRGECLRDFRGSAGDGRLLGIGVWIGDEGEEEVLSYLASMESGAATAPTTDWVLLHGVSVAAPWSPDDDFRLAQQECDLVPMPPHCTWRCRGDLDVLVAPSCPWVRLVLEQPSGAIVSEVVAYDTLGYTYWKLPASWGGDISLRAVDRQGFRSIGAADPRVSGHGEMQLREYTGDGEHAAYDFPHDESITHRTHPGLVAAAAMLQAVAPARRAAERAASAAASARSVFTQATVPQLTSSGDRNAAIFGEGTQAVLRACFKINQVIDRMTVAERVTRDAAAELSGLADEYFMAASRMLEEME